MIDFIFVFPDETKLHSIFFKSFQSKIDFGPLKRMFNNEKKNEFTTKEFIF